jgi:hypothetical protein
MFCPVLFHDGGRFVTASNVRYKHAHYEDAMASTYVLTHLGCMT